VLAFALLAGCDDVPADVASDVVPRPADARSEAPDARSEAPDAQAPRPDATPAADSFTPATDADSRADDARLPMPDAVVVRPDAFVPAPDALVVRPDVFVPTADAFVPAPDALVWPADAFVPTPDALVWPADAFLPAPDAAPWPVDAALWPVDAFVPAPDAFVPAPDVLVWPVDAFSPPPDAVEAPIDAVVPPIDAALPEDAAPPEPDVPLTCPDGFWGVWCENPCDCDDGLFCNGAESCDRDEGCLPGVPPEPVDDGDACTLDGPCDEVTAGFPQFNDDASPLCAPPRPVPTHDPRDFAFWYWPGNHRPVESWPVVSRTMHFLTGFYAFAFNEETGDLETLGALSNATDVESALMTPNVDIDSLPVADIRFEAGTADGWTTADTFLGGQGNDIGRARLIDGGRMMNRVDIPTLRSSSDPAYAGRLEIASMPRHVVFNHTATSSAWRIDRPSTTRVVLSGDWLAAFPVSEWLVADRALKRTDENGDGWIFIVYGAADAATRLLADVDSVTAERTRAVAANQPVSVSLLALPTSAVDEATLAMYLDPAGAVGLDYTLLDRAGVPVRSYPVTWNETLGAFQVPLQTLQTAGAPRGADYDLRPETHTWYGRHRLTLDTRGRAGMAVPLALFGGTGLTWYITGGAFLWRDEAGEPAGLPVQISKNWHLTPAENGYHLYSTPTLGAAPTTLELTAVSSRWGETYAASHAQLSLVGWNDAATGRWDESALGAFGESVTYDPDQTANRSMVDDVRPFLVQADRRWNWTGNVGGADFLRYTTAAVPGTLRRLARVRTHHGMNGPNLTDVVYTGVSTDGRIEGAVRVQLGRTDDLVRVYYHLEYQFLEDVEYGRLAFFQMAADGYGDNQFTRYAYGNEGGPTFEAVVPDHRTTGYARPEDRGIALPGASPWVMLSSATPTAGDVLAEHLADIGFIIRDYEAHVGDAHLRTPHINVHRTFNRTSQMAFELGLPFDAEFCGPPCQGRPNFVPAGSSVRATVEAVVLPAVKDRYYGASPYLLALPPETFGTPALMTTLAAGNHLDVAVEIGALRRTQPIEVDARPAGIAAALTVGGGLGYVPLTFHGLPRHDGWQLERRIGDAWVRVDQAVAGHDYWQATAETTDGTFSLTYNIVGGAPTDYRLRFAPGP
jgi:hypothetical protein